MKKAKIRVLSLFLLFVLMGGSNSFAGEYLHNMKRNFVRGSKNIISSPAEIVIKIKEAHQGPGATGIRHLQGLADGLLGFAKRAFSGIWDFPVAFIPSDQDGMPVEPETLF